MTSMVQRAGWLVCVFTLLCSTVQAQSRGIRVNLPGSEGQPVALYEQSYALLIGISRYSAGWRTLAGVPGDLAAVEDSLRAQGFEVVRGVDLDSADLKDAVRDFIATHGQRLGDRVLVYFAGHGHTIPLTYGGDMGYLVPRDAPLPDRDPTGFLKKAISMQVIEEWARAIQSKHALFVFDSCFSGTVFSATRSGVPAVISTKTIEPVRQFLSSGTASQQVPDQSVFRSVFVAGVGGDADLNRDGYVTVSELGIHMETEVSRYTRGAQTPQYGKLLDPRLDRGDFVFVPSRTASRSGAGTPAAQADSVESTWWESVRDSRNARDLESYLRRYPAGLYAELARNRLATLAPARGGDSGPEPSRPATPMRPGDPDGALVETAESWAGRLDFVRAEDSYRQLLRRHPRSPMVPYARREIAFLLQAQGQWTQAAQAFEGYARTYAEDPEAPTLQFRAAGLWERAGRTTDALRIYRSLGSSPSDACSNDLRMASLGRAVDIGLSTGDSKGTGLLLGDMQRLFDRTKSLAGSPAAQVLARARFLWMERQFQEFESMVLKGPLTLQAQVLQKKANRLQEMQRTYGEIAALQAPGWAAASIYRRAALHENFARTLFTAEIPPMSEEEQDIYSTALEDRAKTYLDVAQETYEILLRTRNTHPEAAPWIRRAVEALNKYRPAEYPLRKTPRLRGEEGRPAEGTREEALARATATLRNHPGDAAAMVAAARAYLSLERPEAAEYLLEQVLRRQPHAEALRLLSWRARVRGDVQTGLDLATQSSEAPDAGAPDFNELGIVQMDVEDFVGAEISFRTAMSRDAGLRAAQVNLACALVAQGRIGEGVAVLEGILAKDSSCEDCHLNLAIGEMSRPLTGSPGPFRKALEHLDACRALRGDRKDPQADAYAEDARRVVDLLEKEAARHPR